MSTKERMRRPSSCDKLDSAHLAGTVRHSDGPASTPPVLPHPQCFHTECFFTTHIPKRATFAMETTNKQTMRVGIHVVALHQTNDWTGLRQ